MRPVSVTVGLTPADANGVCVSQTTAAAAELSLSGGALSATTGIARLGTAATILITCAADESARIFTVTGLNASGVEKVQRLTGVSASTVASTVAYREISKIEIDGPTSGNVSAGITGSTATILTTSTIAATGGGAFTLNGVWTHEATMFGIADVQSDAAVVQIFSTGNDTGITFTVYGQDGDGADALEAVTGGSGASASSTTLFKKVYAILTSNTTADTIYAGWAEDVNGIAELQTAISGAGYLVMNGARCTTQARHVSIFSSGNESSFTFTVVGLDRNGARLTEAITGPTAAATVKGGKNFSVVQAVYINGNANGNITVGSADQCDSLPVIVDYYIAGIGVAVHHSTSSSVNHNFKSTLDNLLAGAKTEDTARWNEEDGVQSADATLNSTATIKAVRVEITSHVRGTVDLLLNFPSGSRY